MPSNTLLIPILNRRTTLFSGPPLIFSNDSYIERISDDEHSAFFRDAPDEVKSRLDINNTKCIKVKIESPTEAIIKSTRTKCVFALNLFAHSSPVVTSWGGYLSGERKMRIQTFTEFESL